VDICKNINKEGLQEKVGPSKHFNKKPRKVHVQVRDGRKDHGKVAEDPIILEEVTNLDKNATVNKGINFHRGLGINFNLIDYTSEDEISCNFFTLILALLIIACNIHIMRH